KPAAVSNLGQVEALPRYLAVFFGLLGLATLGHALATTARLRSRELGTLHALGLTRRAGTAMVASHALTLLLIAVASGLPLGLVAGKQIWAPIANRAHVVVRAVSPWPWIALLLVIAFGATGVVTALPAWRAFR